MIMNVKKQLWSMARLFLPAVGFALTCLGAYMISLRTDYGDSWEVIHAYVIVVFGFLAVMVGVFWTVCHSMKSKMYQRRAHEQHVQVYTIERPSFFPPSYDESQYGQMFPDTAPEFVVVVDGLEMVTSLAPPLYSQDSSEAPDCTWSWEQPPRYSQVERIHQAEVEQAMPGH